VLIAGGGGVYFAWRIGQQGPMAQRKLLETFAVIAFALAAAGCVTKSGQSQPDAMALRAIPEGTLLDERKDEVIRQLAHCESGGWGPSEKKIYGYRGLYHGRLQFSVRTVQAYVKQRDGVQLTAKEASELAHDYERASDLAKYMIFDLEEPWHWPVCNRKIKMAAEVRSIKLGQEALRRL
jgi:hypothetical protein